MKRKHHLRRRSWPFWVCLSATALLLSVNLATVWYALGFRWTNGAGHPRVVSVEWGAVRCVYHWATPHPVMSARLRMGWLFLRNEAHVFWLPRYSTRGAFGAGVTLPLWPAVLAMSVVTVWAHRRSLRPLPGRCRCGYDLAGIGDGVPCPERGSER